MAGLSLPAGTKRVSFTAVGSNMARKNVKVERTRIVRLPVVADEREAGNVGATVRRGAEGERDPRTMSVTAAGKIDENRPN
eukprot:2811465-Prymnesium_polylepis.1